MITLPNFSGATSSSSPPFTPLKLFAAGEQGVWYDPSDYSTMFTTTTGTTQVTGVEQAVGLLLDKRKGVTDIISQKYGSLPGTANNYFSTPDSVKNSITGDIDIRVYTALTDWTPAAEQVLIAKYSAGDNNRCYYLSVFSTGILRLVTNPTGIISGTLVYDSTAAPSVADGQALWVRATLDVNNGSGGKTAVFYTSTNGSDWTQLGGAVTTSGTTSIFNGTNILEVGSVDLGVSSVLNGRIYRAQLYNGINGTLAVDFCPPYGWTSGTWTSTLTSEVWTANGTASVVSLTTSGNHASQTTLAARPVLRARYNLLTYTQEFDNAIWQKARSSAANTTATADPLGGNTANKLTEDTQTGAHYVVNPISSFATAATSYTFSWALKAAQRTFAVIGTGNIGGETGLPVSGICVNLSTGAVTATNGTYSASSVVPLGDGWWRCSITVLGVAGQTGRFWAAMAQNGSTADITATGYTGDNTSGIYIWGADLRVANDGVGLPVYQRVAAATDYDTVGFPQFLSFDGTDDFLITGSVNFSSINELSLWAGVRKLSDAARGIIVEQGVGGIDTDVFYLSAPNAASSAAYTMAVKSGGILNTVTTFTAPITNVVSGAFSLAAATLADVIKIRVNAASPTETVTGLLPGGSFYNRPFYIGCRGGTTLPFNGRIYSLIIRGADTPLATVQQTETWVNGKTKAY